MSKSNNTKEVWKEEAWYAYFKEICSIPHPSFHVEAISNYLKKFASEHGLKCTQDKAYNIVIRKKASKGREDEPVMILQGHMDMVGVKTEDCPLDLTKDGLKLVEKDGYLWADGTSLGGDDGIAVAYILAILASDTISHPKLEALITVNEEVGMLGASALSGSAIKGRRMINLDTEVEGEIIAGCAGGVRLDGRKHLDMFRREGQKVILSVGDMTGGHSGTQIHLGRGNAARVIAEIIAVLAEDCGGQLISLYSGEQDNVIPGSATAELLFKADRITEVIETTEKLYLAAREKWQNDPNMKITATVSDEKISEYLVFTKQDTLMVCELLRDLPNGVVGMSSTMEGLVETSTNIGIVRMKDHEISITAALRSSVLKEKEKLLQKMQQIFKAYGFETGTHGDYPGWEYDATSPLCQKAAELYPSFFAREPVVTAVHAGLECGVIMDKVGKVDCIAIGPDIEEIHSVHEKLDLASCQRVWNFLVELLKTTI